MLIDGCPSGIMLEPSDFISDLERRKPGAAGTTARKETDIPLLKSGVFNGYTTGTPIMLLFENKDIDSASYEKIKQNPRPGHADLVAIQKYHGFNDYRGGGHFSGRVTLPLVAAGVIAKKILGKIQITATLIEVGGSKSIEKAVTEVVKNNDSIGGIVECRVNGLPAGLGEPFFDSAESLLGHILFSVPAVKAIEFGAGFAAGKMKGSEYNDVIISTDGKTATNNAGGINGGITNGNELLFRIAVKPTSSISKPMKTVDMKTGKQVEIVTVGRHDTCIALRIPVIVEAVTAIVLADMMLIHRSYENQNLFGSKKEVK